MNAAIVGLTKITGQLFGHESCRQSSGCHAGSKYFIYHLAIPMNYF